ncbi:hypothetical protein [Georgenia sp. MJ170]|uniref:hypothetical protein n=1 Tax=Georgenia sunbinii TaxID=3117728 RepID=UPI002F25F799
MADDEVPRIGRPSWRDPRLGVGVLLVAAAVVLGSWTVSRAAQTVDVYITDTALTPGDVVSAADLRAAAVRPDGLESYLPVEAGLPDGAVVTRVVGPGELVPAAALGRPQDVDVRPVVVELGRATGGVVKGAVVDLWLTPPPPSAVSGEVAAPTEPHLLAGGLVVAGLAEADSIFAGSGGSAAQVLVPQEDLPAVLAAVSGTGTIVVVPVPGGGP